MKIFFSILLLLLLGCDRGGVVTDEGGGEQPSQKDYNYDGTAIHQFSQEAVEQCNDKFQHWISENGLEKATNKIMMVLFSSLSDKFPLYAPAGEYASFYPEKDGNNFSFQHTVTGDIDGNGKVERLDLDSFIENFDNDGYDLNNDNLVDINDLIYLAGRYHTNSSYYYIYSGDGEQLLDIIPYSKVFNYSSDLPSIYVVVKDQNRASRVSNICDKDDEWISKVSQKDFKSKNFKSFDITQKIIEYANDMMDGITHTSDLYTWKGTIVPTSTTQLPAQVLEDIFNENIIEDYFSEYNMGKEPTTEYQNGGIWKGNGGYPYESQDNLFGVTEHEEYNFSTGDLSYPLNINLGQTVVQIMVSETILFDAVVLVGKDSGKPELKGNLVTPNNSFLTNYDKVMLTRLGPGEQNDEVESELNSIYDGEFSFENLPAGNYKVEMKYSDSSYETISEDWIYIPGNEIQLSAMLKKHNFECSKDFVWDITFDVHHNFYELYYQVSFNDVKLAYNGENLPVHNYTNDDGAIAPFKYYSMHSIINDTLICMTDDQSENGFLTSSLVGELSNFGYSPIDVIGADGQSDGLEDYTFRVSDDYEPAQLRVSHTRDNSISYGNGSSNYTLDPNRIYLEFHLTDILSFDWRYQEGEPEEPVYAVPWMPTGVLFETKTNLTTPLSQEDLFVVSQLSTTNNEKILKGESFSYEYNYDSYGDEHFDRTVTINFQSQLMEVR